MLEDIAIGAWRASEKRVTLQVYLPLCEPLRILNSSGNELAVGGPTVIPSPFITLSLSESSQVKIGVLRIPFRIVAEHTMSYMLPAIGLPTGRMDKDKAVTGTAICKIIVIWTFHYCHLLCTVMVALLSSVP